MPRRILGVDAGGTSTRAVVVDEGRVVDHRELGPMNFLLHDDSAARIAALIGDTAAEAAGLGLPGVQSAADAGRVSEAIRALTTAAVCVTDDSETALFAAFDGAPGIVVIAGTGSIACGRGQVGPSLRVGGHGYLLGDEGGGYWIGRACLRAALRASDGTGPPTALRGVVTELFGPDLQDAVRRVHCSPTDRRMLTALVPPAAALDDPVVEQIFNQAASYLVELAEALRVRLGPLPVAMVGGVFRIAAVRDHFVEATGAVDAAVSPELGAVRYAEHMLMGAQT